MNKILFSVFDSEDAAYEGIRALKDLHRNGDITLYASAVVGRDAQGHVSIRQAAPRGPVGTLVGVVTGSLVGLVSGPVGAAIGASIGGTSGVLFDLFSAGFGLDVVDDVSALLTPGKTAIVADIDEYWVTPIESRLAALGGTTLRRFPGEVLDEQLAREALATKVELEHLRAELAEGAAEAKAGVRAAIEDQQRKLELLANRVDTAIDTQSAEVDARLTTLREQWDEANGRRKDRIEARIAWVKASHEARQAKLRKAREHAKQALELTREAVAG